MKFPRCKRLSKKILIGYRCAGCACHYQIEGKTFLPAKGALEESITLGKNSGTAFEEAANLTRLAKIYGINRL